VFDSKSGCCEVKNGAVSLITVPLCKQEISLRLVPSFQLKNIKQADDEKFVCVYSVCVYIQNFAKLL